MKYSYIPLLVAEVQLLGLAIAQPHRHQQIHKRDGEIITATIWQTVQAPDVVVYVDENGNLITQGAQAAATPAPAPAPVNPVPLAPAPMVTAAPAAPAPAPAPAAPAPAPAPAPQAPAPQAPPPAPAPPAAASSASVETNNFATEEGFIDNTPGSYGIAWSGYKGTENDASCKTLADADAEWATMGSSYGVVRVYGTDCDQPSIAMTLGKKYNKKVFLGLYWLDSRIPQQVQTIVDAVQSSAQGWGGIDTISVGNEDVHRGEQSPAQIFAAVAQAKIQLRLAGYRGPVVHVDSQEAILANPSLCSHHAGDYIAANIHAFFNPTTPADQAGDFVQNQVSLLQACGAANRKIFKNVRVRVTETGWPTAGNANGDAVPSKENQAAAVASLKKAFSTNIIMFSAFNNYWMKNDASTFNTEHYWGMFDN